MKKIVIIVFVLLSLLLASCTERLKVQNNPPIYALNTTIDVTFYNTDNYELHYKKIKEIYNDVSRIASDFESNYNETSVYDLNQKRKINSSLILVDLINKALYYKELTNGYYNPFIGRISHIWKEALDTKLLPDENLINSEIEIMNNTNIVINEDTITLIGDGNLDLGGIAKGYATELVYQYLKENNITGYLIDAGNSSITLGSKGKNTFRLGLINPIENNYYAYLNLRNTSIATSSFQHQKAIIDGNIYHHLVNPKTGYPSNLYSSLSIVGIDNTMLDVLSTAMFSMSIDEIKEFEELYNLKAIILKDNDIIYQNEGCDFLEKA